MLAVSIELLESEILDDFNLEVRGRRIHLQLELRFDEASLRSRAWNPLAYQANEARVDAEELH